MQWSLYYWEEKMPASLQIFFLILPVLFLGCVDHKDSENHQGKQLAITHCGSCHAFPEPELLDKTSWKENVLPAMAGQLGIDHIYEMQMFEEHPVLSVNDWKKIVSYYMDEAPATIKKQDRDRVNKVTGQFEVIKSKVNAGGYPATSFVKIDPGNQWILAADEFGSLLVIYDNRLRIKSENAIKGTLVDMQFTGLMKEPGARTGLYTLIGDMHPNDGRTGSADSFSLNAGGYLNYDQKILDSLPRPVQTIPFGINANGDRQYLVCGFGNKKGALYLASAKGVQSSLIPLPGAIKAYSADFNADGINDIIVLMAQADESIDIFYGRKDGSFDKARLLTFSPLNGSSYFELADFNDDGHQDILYTCGDNADYTGNTLKYYHGIYIFMNDGKNNFHQKYFFPLDGCFKAMAADFDKDGDLDIAGIAYFPDEVNKPDESFIYLEQTEPLVFTPSIIKEAREGRWLAMDVGDVDNDGDADIVLGSMVVPNPVSREKWKNKGGRDTQLLLLINKN